MSLTIDVLQVTQSLYVEYEAAWHKAEVIKVVATGLVVRYQDKSESRIDKDQIATRLFGIGSN